MANNQPAKKEPQRDEVSNPMQNIVLPKDYYTLKEAVKVVKSILNNITVEDILHYGSKGKIRLITSVPKDRVIGVINQGDPMRVLHSLTGSRWIAPHMVELGPMDCMEIEIYGNATQSDFMWGYTYFNGIIQDCPPSNGSMWVTSFQLEPKVIELKRTNILISHVELTRLTQEIELLIANRNFANNQKKYGAIKVFFEVSQDFEIPPFAEEFLLSNGYISLADAVEIAKRRHQGCTQSDLLSFGKHDEQLVFITPVPVGISLFSVCQSYYKMRMSFNDARMPKKIPETLILTCGDCNEIREKGKAKRKDFLFGYSFYWGNSTCADDHFVKTSASNDGNQHWMFGTFYKDNEYEIDLTCDRLFVKKDELSRIIDTESDIWEKVGNEFNCRNGNISNCHLALNNPQNPSETVNAESTSSNIDAERDQYDTQVKDNVVKENLDGKPEYQQPSESSNKGYSESSAINLDDYYSMNEVIDLLGCARDTVYQRMKVGGNYYDSTFPKNVKFDPTLKNSQILFEKKLIDAWNESNPRIQKKKRTSRK